MKRSMSLLAIISMSCKLFAFECPPESIKISGYCAASLVSIISNASQYFDKKIETQGYLARSNGRYYLVLTKYDTKFTVSYTGVLLGDEKIGNKIGSRIKIRGKLVKKIDMYTPASYYFLTEYITVVSPVVLDEKKAP
jgi:hypothetical protein